MVPLINVYVRARTIIISCVACVSYIPLSSPLVLVLRVTSPICVLGRVTAMIQALRASRIPPRPPPPPLLSTWRCYALARKRFRLVHYIVIALESAAA